MRVTIRTAVVILCLTLILAVFPAREVYAQDNGGPPSSLVIVANTYGADLIGAGSSALYYGGSAFLGGSGAGFLWAMSGYDAAKSVQELMQPGTGTIGSRIDRSLAVIDLSMSVFAIGAGIVAAAGTVTIGGALVAAVGATGTAFLVAKILIAMGRQVALDIDVILSSLPDPNAGDLDVRKPNIYIYSDIDITVNVKLEPYEYITCSIPLYDKERGWDADIYDGSINGCNDFLFYEALVPEGRFQSIWGFVVNGDNMKDDMLEMLGLYKFNQVEKADFIEYWQKELCKENTWIFYPQETEIVDSIMPLYAEPVPDKIYRIWFLIEPYVGQDFMEKQPNETIERNGYIIVEWGGMLKVN